MQFGSSSSRRTTSARNGVISGSVWESRMKVDEVKGGIKVFNGDGANSVGGTDQKKKENSVRGGGAGNGGDQCGSSLQVYRRLKRNQSGGETEKNRKTMKSEHVEGIERNPIQLRKTRSDGIEKNPIQTIRKTRSDESRNSKDFGVIKDKTISISSSNVGQIRNKKPVVDYDDDDDDDGVDGDQEDEGEEEEEKENEDLDEEREIEIENKNYDVKEVNIEEQKQPKRVVNEENKNQMSQELVVLPICSSVSKKSPKVIDHPVNDPDLKNPPSKKSCSVKEINIEEQKPKKVVIEEKKLNQIHKTTLSNSSRVSKQPPPAINYPVTDPNPTKVPPSSDEFERFPESQNNLQNIVDLVMWRDVSKSTLVFGFGSFVLLSSSFTKDLNFSLISAVSYMGLLYLAAIFLYKSIICRGAIDFEDSSKNLVGEEEAIWLLKMILPYLNEFLLKLRSLFSGDPATTMKLAVLLFILARCGSSITIWKVAKLGFFGVFTVPKICSSYSTQLTGYGKFWIRRFRDAWDSCSHKKAVALAGFTLVWNLSSIVARIWAVFMLIVAVRYYQQSILINDGWGAEEEVVVVNGDDSYQIQDGGPITVEVVKEKKSW
ncbi:Reticulon [Macleaya cordata]|uniref:Reticulon-like protein n=1 Tax=Macleaya cordata TaxID=56857 RepID=A0A200QFK5_MACCD|nr:Reticulon [Macleaya cordata]